MQVKSVISFIIISVIFFGSSGLMKAILEIKSKQNQSEASKNISKEVSNNISMNSMLKENFSQEKVLRLKTPVEVLSELGQKKNKPVEYDIGASNEGLFKATAKFDNREAEGFASKKKDAKQNAAKALIDKLSGLKISEDFYYEKNTLRNSSAAPIVQVKSLNDSSTPSTLPFVVPVGHVNIEMGNYVGLLLELCHAKKLKHPVYQLEAETTFDSNSMFTTRCTFARFNTSGTGISKKSSKQKAAEEMWLLLKEHKIVA